jgi:hypothetical protein
MLRLIGIATVLLFAPILARSGEVLDRLAVTVNAHVLLESDIDEELRYECFAAKRPITERSSEQRNAAIGRLIDQELLRSQMRSSDFKAVSVDEVMKALALFRSEYGTSDSWSAALATYELNESKIRSRIETELNQLRLIDLRLRPGIQIDSEAVKTYYEQQFLPKLAAGQHATLQEASAGIRELLVQQHINESLEPWLQSLRAQAKIHRFDDAPGDDPK